MVSGREGSKREAEAIALQSRGRFVCYNVLGEALKKTRSVQLWKKGPAKMSSVCFYSNSLKCVTPQLRSLSASLWTHIGPQPDKEIHTTLEILALSVVETILILGRYATTPRYLHRSYLGWTRVAS